MRDRNYFRIRSNIPFLLLAVLMVLPGSISAQTTATTEDGREVVLHADGTWEWAEQTEGDSRLILPLFEDDAFIEFIGYDDPVRVEFFGPDDGFRYVAVEVLIDNTDGAETIDFNIYMGAMIECRADSGYDYSVVLSRPKKPDLDLNAEIPPGHRLRGWVTFEVHEELAPGDLFFRYVGGRGQDFRTRWISAETLMQ